MNVSNKHRLSVIIPAYNEEEAIAAIIERSLMSRNSIVETSPVSSVEIIVVNDGSQDKTAQIASQYEDIKLITHAKNKGYGAAIKTGFENATGNILGFLDKVRMEPLSSSSPNYRDTPNQQLHGALHQSGRHLCSCGLCRIEWEAV